MSYSFNWDCTLPINNIADIVSLNIVPNTKAHDEGDYLSLRGDVSIDGEYLTTEGTQKTFSEHIPLDITLPNSGKKGDINADITNFDYDVKGDNSLALSLNLTLEGYDLGDVVKLVDEDHHEEDSQTQAPVMFNKGAEVAKSEVCEVVELEPAVGEVNEIEVVEDDSDYIDFDEVVFDHQPMHEAIDPMLAEERKEALTDKIKKVIEKQTATVSDSTVKNVVEPTKETEVTVVEPVVGEEVKVEKEHHKAVPEIPVVHQEVEVEETEEVLPFPIKKENAAEVTVKPQQKSEIFDMLYSLEGEHPITNDSVEDVVETVVEAPQPVEEAELLEVAEKMEELAPNTSVSVVSNEDSIANQFSDGESILKIIFVQEEETTITNICTKYGVSEKEIYNKDELATPLRCGDRVMINYGKLR